MVSSFSIDGPHCGRTAAVRVCNSPSHYWSLFVPFTAAGKTRSPLSFAVLRVMTVLGTMVADWHNG